MTDELELLNDAWNKAWLEKDVGAVERMMGSEYVYIAPNGQVLDRRAILAIIRDPSCHLIGGARTEVSVKALGEAAALVMHRWQGEGLFGGKSFKDDHRCTRVWRREGNAWRIVHEQCSPIAG